MLNARATRRFSNQDWTYDSSRVEGADTQRSEGLTGLSALHAAEADARAGAFATFAEATSASADGPEKTLKRFVSFMEQDTSPGGVSSASAVCPPHLAYNARVRWSPEQPLRTCVVEGYTDFMELWPPGPFYARRPGFSGILHDMGLKVANYTDE